MKKHNPVKIKHILVKKSGSRNQTLQAASININKALECQNHGNEYRLFPFSSFHCSNISNIVGFHKNFMHR